MGKMVEASCLKKGQQIQKPKVEMRQTERRSVCMKNIMEKKADLRIHKNCKYITNTQSST